LDKKVFAAIFIWSHNDVELGWEKAIGKKCCVWEPFDGNFFQEKLVVFSGMKDRLIVYSEIVKVIEFVWFEVHDGKLAREFEATMRKSPI
jgi:hypothetical protein